MHVCISKKHKCQQNDGSNKPHGIMFRGKNIRDQILDIQT